VARWARIRAAERNTSVSRLVGELLKEEMRAEKGYRQAMERFLARKPICTDGQLLEEAWGLQDRFRLPWWDALLAAAARVSDCRYLLSEDFQEGIELGELRVVNPFLNEPDNFL